MPYSILQLEKGLALEKRRYVTDFLELRMQVVVLKCLKINRFLCPLD